MDRVMGIEPTLLAWEASGLSSIVCGLSGGVGSRMSCGLPWQAGFLTLQPQVDSVC